MPEPHEDLADRPGETLVHGETLAFPVAGAAQALQLVQDDAAVLLLPLPDALDELLPAQVVPRLSLLGQLLLDHVLRRDPGVVRARHPEGVVALHAPVARHDVLQGVVQGVPHVEHPRDVGGRDDDAEGLSVTHVLRVEIPVLEPELVPLRLHIPGLVGLRQCIRVHRSPHWICSVRLESPVSPPFSEKSVMSGFLSGQAPYVKDFSRDRGSEGRAGRAQLRRRNSSIRARTASASVGWNHSIPDSPLNQVIWRRA
ncbi:MAG: hypothetical protein A4E67_00646 [Syntrophaceae bacterium PtaB.Bin038]|nr:MAG: hypothetical protein A4E67_00646 [Syntrophaceae bacterium PtaB.Bin038]